MHRVTGRSGLSVGVYVAALLLLAPGAGRTAAAAEAESAAPDGAIAAQAIVLASAAGQDEPAADTAPADTAGGAAEFFRQITVSGLVDGYYQWVFSEEAPLLRSFDVNHNNFSLSYAEIAIEKEVSETSRAGFRVDFGAGDTATVVNSFEPGGEDYLKFVQQAYVSYLIPAGKGLKFDFGKFVTPHGGEVIEAADNYNYSRGILFGYAIPFYHAGARLSYAATDQVTLTGYVVNGWNSVIDNNTGKTLGLSVSVAPSDRYSFGASYMFGPEADDNNDDFRHLLDTLFSYTISEQTSFLANFDYGRDTADGTSDWYGVAASLRHQLNDTWAVAPRYEILRDDEGWATGQAQTVQSLTLTAEHKISDFITRLEWRSDFSDEPFFPDGDALKKNQSAIIVAFIYTFASK